MKEYDDDSIMHFGKHKGQTLGSIPSKYLLWLWDNVIWCKTQHDSQEDWSLHCYLKTALNDMAKEAGYIVEHKPKI